MNLATQVRTTCVSGWVLQTLSSRRILAGVGILAICLVLTAITGFAQTVPVADWPKTESRLTNLLSGDAEQKRTALAEIRNLQTERASRLAVAALTDKNEIVRATAASSVVFLPKNDAAKALLPLLGDEMPFVRREAAFALGTVGDPAATGKLRQLLSGDRDLEVRAAAAAALGNIGDPSAIDDLVRVLNKRPTEDDEFIRRSAARAIGQIFELAATGSTATLTPQNFLPPKFKKLGSAESLAQLYQRTDVNSVVATLSRVLQNADEADDTRREAAFALGAVRQPASASVLRTYITGPDPYLAEISREALLKIEKPE
jgi:HEAT repeat protein